MAKKTQTLAEIKAEDRAIEAAHEARLGAMAEKLAHKTRLVAYADFALGHREFHAGDEFVPPMDLERDLKAEEARRVEKLRGRVRGLCFIRTIDRGPKKDPDFQRFILPLEEA